MTCIDEGFPGAPSAQWVPPNPDDKYELLIGTERVSALEQALGSRISRNWHDAPAERALDWIRKEGNPQRILSDFGMTDQPDAYPKVWEAFGWAYPRPAETPTADNSTTSSRIADLLNGLSVETLRAAIDGIAHLLDTWANVFVALPEISSLWAHLWPIAVDATNALQPPDAPPDLNIQVKQGDGHEPEDLDTLNSAAGKLMTVFMAACPNLKDVPHPFEGGELRKMRDAAVAAPGRSGLIARHVMIRSLGYFLNADEAWTRAHLMSPLTEPGSENPALWRAVALARQSKETLAIIGEAMADRAADASLGRDTRQALVFSLVVESMHALNEDRNPAVSFDRVQQMLRAVDDEVRAHAAGVVGRYIAEMSQPQNSGAKRRSPEELFQRVGCPFLIRVWPREQTLVTPGVARAFSGLPVRCGESFAEAVESIERFLVPFNCWSLSEYGLRGDEEGEARLSSIDTPRKAKALMRLLDATIGTAEDAVIPIDLGQALDQIREVAPDVLESRNYRRLATLTRR